MRLVILMSKQELKVEIRDFYTMLDNMPEFQTVSLDACNRLDDLKKELCKRA